MGQKSHERGGTDSWHPGVWDFCALLTGRRAFDVRQSQRYETAALHPSRYLAWQTVTSADTLAVADAEKLLLQH